MRFVSVAFDRSFGQLPQPLCSQRRPLHLPLAGERVAAGAAAARALGQDFVFVARADGIMNGFYDIEEAIRRLQAFDAAGADCLYAPLLR